MSTKAFKLVDLANWAGVTSARITQWKKEGMPTGDLGAAKAWVGANYPRSGANERENIFFSAAGQEAPRRKPLKRDLKRQDLVGQLGRAKAVEFEAFEHHQEGQAANASATEMLTRIRRWNEAAKACVQLETKVMDLLQRQRKTAVIEEVYGLLSDHLMPLDKRLESMPVELAHLVNPGDPDHAEKELIAWRDDLREQMREGAADDD